MNKKKKETKKEKTDRAGDWGPITSFGRDHIGESPREWKSFTFEDRGMNYMLKLTKCCHLDRVGRFYANSQVGKSFML